MRVVINEKHMQFDIVTIFPGIFDSYFSESILKRAQEKQHIEMNIHNLRDYTTDKHHTTDDTPYGGGPGMVMKVGPIVRAIEDIEASSPGKTARVILTSAKGSQYTQARARKYVKDFDQLIILCGRYEGVDERVMEMVDDEISVGPYVLTGGEIAAMAITDSITRLLPGVLGNVASSKDESHSKEGLLEYPQYTKPENFRGWKVPEVLLSGNHEEISKWRKEQMKHVKK